MLLEQWRTEEKRKLQVLEEARGQRLDPARKGTARECEDSCGFGNLVIAETDRRVVQNSLAYCVRSDGVR